VQLPADVPDHPTQQRALAPQHTPHALELAGVCVAPGLAGQPRRLPLVGLAQLEPLRRLSSTSFLRATSSRRLSVGWAIAFSRSVQLPAVVPDHPAQQRALAPQHTPHALELAGVCVAPGLAGQPRRLPLVGLAQLEPLRRLSSTSFLRATSSRRLSVGWAIAFS